MILLGNFAIALQTTNSIVMQNALIKTLFAARLSQWHK